MKLPKRVETHNETCALYMGLFKRRDELKEYLRTKGIETKIHYPKPLHLQHAARENCKFNPRDMANSEHQARHLLTLPVHQFLGEYEINYIADQIFAFYEKN